MPKQPSAQAPPTCQQGATGQLANKATGENIPLRAGPSSRSKSFTAPHGEHPYLVPTVPYGQFIQPMSRTPVPWWMRYLIVRNLDRDVSRAVGARSLLSFERDADAALVIPQLRRTKRTSTQRRDNSNSAFLPAVPGIERVRSSNQSHLGSR